MSAQLSLLPPRWVCEYCGRPESHCIAAREGNSIMLVDANNPDDDEETA